MMPNLPDFPIKPPWEGLPFPRANGGSEFQPGGYRSSPQDEMEMTRRLTPYVEDERKANIDYEHESDLAYSIGRPDIAATLQSMAEDEFRHYLNIKAMLEDLGGI